MKEDVKVMESSEVLLQAAQRRGERRVVFGIDGRREIGHLTESADPDPEPVQPVHRRPTAGLSMGRDDLVPAAALVLREDPPEVRARRRPRVELERLRYVVEEPRLPLGAKERAQELPAGPAIFLETGAVLAELLGLLLRAGSVGDPLEQLDRDVAVPHLSDEPGETPDPRLQRAELSLAGRAEELLPDSEPGAQSPHRPVEPMEAPRGRARTTDHLVHIPHDLGQDSAQLRAKPVRIEGPGRSVALHVRSLPRGTPADW